VEFLQANWFWLALAIISGGWLLIDTARAQNDGSRLSPIEATLLINREDAVVLDVRDQGEYEQGHIANARHIPLAELPQRLGELEKFKAKPIIVYCASGRRSATAISQLQKAGFEKLYNLTGGLQEWEKTGQPVTRKKKSK